MSGIQVTFDTTSHGHAQLSDDQKLINRDAFKLIERWLTEHDCPEGAYKVIIHKRIFVDGQSETFSNFYYDADRNMINLLAKFGSRNDTRRNISLLPPLDVSAKTVFHLLTENAPRLAYDNNSQMNKSVFDTVLQALIDAECPEHYLIKVTGNGKKLTIPGRIVITGIPSKFKLNLTCQPQGKAGYSLELTCPCGDSHDVALRWLEENKADSVIESLGSTLLGQKAVNKIGEGLLSLAEEDLSIQVVHLALHKLLMHQSFPLLPRGTVRQVLRESCGLVPGAKNTMDHLSPYLVQQGNTYRLNQKAYDTLLTLYAGVKHIGVDALDGMYAETGNRLKALVANAEAMEEDLQRRQRQFETAVSEKEARVKELEAQLEAAKRELDAVKKNRVPVPNHNLEALREAMHAAAPLLNLADLFTKLR